MAFYYPYRLQVVKTLRTALIPVPGATVKVFISGTGTPKTLWADKLGAVPLSQPLSTDSSGEVEFYLSSGRIRIEETIDSTTTKTIEEVIFDQDRLDSLASVGLLEFVSEVNLGGNVVQVTGAAPANIQVHGVTVLVLEDITGITDGFQVGTTDFPVAWGTSIGLTAGTQSGPKDFSPIGVVNFSEAPTIVLSPISGSFTGGKVKITVHYVTMATS